MIFTKHSKRFWYHIWYQEYWPPRISKIFTTYSKCLDSTFDIKSIDLLEYQWYSPSTLRVMASQNVEMQEIHHLLNSFHLIIQVDCKIITLQKLLPNTSDDHLEVVTSSWYTQGIGPYKCHMVTILLTVTTY